MKIISRGTKKNGKATAQIIVNNRTFHLIQVYTGGPYTDFMGGVYHL